MIRGSLRLRLLVAGAVSIVLALALAALGLSLLFERHVERRVEAELKAHLDQLVAGLERGGDGALTLGRRPADPRFERPLSGLYWELVIDGGRRPLRSRSLWDSVITLPPDVLVDGEVHRHRLEGPGGSVLMVLERRVVVGARDEATRIRAAVAVDRAEIEAARRAFLVDLGPYLALLGVLLIAAAALQVQVGLRPLGQLRRRLAAIREGAASRLGGGFPSEVRPLAGEFDALLATREAEVERARRRAQDLAHGLKTPLQVLSGDAAALEARGETALAREITEVSATMRRHVERELARARLAGARPTAVTEVVTVVERVVGVVRRTPEGARLDWRLDADGAPRARIDADDLAEALGNLLENAARHAVARVTVRATRHDRRVVVSVADDGPGIPPERRGAVLDRGVRFDEAADGAGLGLAIVQEIADAWGGAFTLGDAEPGLVARLDLPSA